MLNILLAIRVCLYSYYRCTNTEPDPSTHVHYHTTLPLILPAQGLYPPRMCTRTLGTLYKSIPLLSADTAEISRPGAGVVDLQRHTYW